MKTSFMSFASCLFLLIGFVVSVNAVGLQIGPGQPDNLRSWRLDEQITQRDVIGSWRNNKRIQNYYNLGSSVLPDSVVQSYFDDNYGWTPDGVDYYTYDVSGQYVTEILSTMIMLGDPIAMSRGIFTYDASNNLTDASLQINGAGIDRDWLEIKRMHIIYQYGGRNLFQIVSWELETVDYPPLYTKSEFTFDNLGRIITQHEYTSEDSLNWVSNYYSTFTYHPDDTTSGQSLVNMISKKLPFSWFYDQPMQIGLISEQIKQMWLFSYWRNDTKDTYTYSHTGARNSRALTYHQQYTWTMVGEWQNYRQNTYNYDSNGNLCSDLYQTWDESSSFWQNDMLVNNIWSQTTGVDDEVIPSLKDLALSVYPNPFNDKFVFEVRSKIQIPVKIEIFNVKGQKIHQEMVAPNAKSALNSALFDKQMSSGVYFLKASQGTNSKCEKVIKLNK